MDKIEGTNVIDVRPFMSLAQMLLFRFKRDHPKGGQAQPH